MGLSPVVTAMARDPIDYGDLTGQCNYWACDPTLRSEVERTYPDAEFEWARPMLREFGEVVGTTIAANSEVVDRHDPELHTYDEAGAVANAVEYHPRQFETERLAYEEFRLTSDAFHAPPGRDDPVGLLHPLTMQALLCYADVGFACPASMTVGAALVLQKFDDGSLDRYFEALTTADYDDHAEGAMFLTEKQGGSDVGANETRAEPVEEAPTPEGSDPAVYELTGEKWFCSNVDAQGALVLARTPDAPEGTAGLSLFLVPHRLPDGGVNDALVRRLKDKLGTLSVPTGEIEFEGATAYLVGEEGAGFRQMTEMLTYERLTNATGAVGVMGRALLEAKVHAADREAFGETIQEFPLLRRDLCRLTVEYEAAAAFAFEAARVYDRRERRYPDRGDAYRLMRLLVPVAKYRTAELAVEISSEAMEILGGNGYVRGHVTERLLRDAQVLPIWEGTSNILSLDVLRALDRADAHEALVPYVADRLDGLDDRLAPLAGTVQSRFEELQSALGTLATADERTAQYHAKRLADLLYDVVAATVLLTEADADLAAGDARKALVAEWFVESNFGGDEAYGITRAERPGDEYFDAIARYGGLEPDALEWAQ
jgi:acyl-CoA dehydrogenase